MSDTTFSPDSHLALITGATGGIGKATCHTLARLGISIAAHYHAAKDDAMALVEELRHKYSVRAECFQTDMGDFDAVSWRGTHPDDYGEHVPGTSELSGLCTDLQP
jgi:3-oxoacyl-[acyl-carrier protein] reductase